jgi:hypothetical protein
MSRGRSGEKGVVKLQLEKDALHFEGKTLPQRLLCAKNENRFKIGINLTKKNYIAATAFEGWKFVNLFPARDRGTGYLLLGWT